MSGGRERELPQTDWHQLLLVWLHDPVNKALAIRRHEVRAARYASGAFDQDVSRNEIKDLASLGDQQAARAERIPMPTAGDKGGGRSSGFRTIVLFRRGELAFFGLRVRQEWPGEASRGRARDLPTAGRRVSDVGAVKPPGGAGGWGDNRGELR